MSFLEKLFITMLKRFKMRVAFPAQMHFFFFNYTIFTMFITALSLMSVIWVHCIQLGSGNSDALSNTFTNKLTCLKKLITLSSCHNYTKYTKYEACARSTPWHFLIYIKRLVRQRLTQMDEWRDGRTYGLQDT